MSLVLFPEKVQDHEEHIEKGPTGIKTQVLPVSPASQRKTWRMCLPFLLPFFLTGLNSNSSPLVSISSRCPASSLPLPLCRYICPLPSCRLLPHHPSPRLSFCHFAPLFVPSPFSFFFSLPLRVPHSPSLFCLSVSVQPTSVTRRCSCARMAGRAFRTRSASVLRSLRGSCANTPAARRARTATLPLPCTPPHC